MVICFINPPFLFPTINAKGRSRALGIRSISAFLKKKGFNEIIVIDGYLEGFDIVKPYNNGFIRGLSIDEIIDRIPEDASLICLSVPFSQLAPIAHELTSKCKERFPIVPVIMGGIYPSTQPKLALSSKADLIIVGEGEIPISQYLEGINPLHINGLYTPDDLLNNEGIFKPSDLVNDLDDIPYPDCNLPQIEKYFNTPNKKTASLLTSRGCPFLCEFCSVHPVSGYRYRARSAGHVLKEISFLVETYGIRNFEIEDDNFSLNKKRTIEILEGIIELNKKGAGLKWRTPNGLRIDSLDEEILKLMKKSNCESITLALEHGTEEMLKLMNKHLNLEKAYEVIKNSISIGLSPIILFIIVGYPGETEEYFNAELKYLERIKSLGGNIILNVNIAQPYPGTKLLEKCQRQGFIEDNNFDNFLLRRDQMSTHNTVSIITPDFNENEVLHRKEILEKMFSVKPTRISSLKKIIRYLFPQKLVK